MTTGQMDEQIELKTRSVSTDRGSVVNTYTTLATVWAFIKSQKGNEAFEAERVNAHSILRVKIRYRNDFGTKDIFVWRGDEYHVTAIDETERRKGYLWITARGSDV